MTPQLQHMSVDGREPVAQTKPAGAIAPISMPSAPPAPRELTLAERQGLAMAWAGMALGIILLLGGLALWAAVAFSAGFGGWLIAMGLLGLVMLVVVVAVNYVLRPQR
jgi:hypothetical protein